MSKIQNLTVEFIDQRIETIDSIVTQVVANNGIVFTPDFAKEMLLLDQGKLPKVYDVFGIRMLHRRAELFPNVTNNHAVIAKYFMESGIVPKKILDLGCGVGYVGNAAAVLGTKEIVFSDLSPIALYHALANYEINNLLDLSDLAQMKHQYGITISTPKHSLDFRAGPSQNTMLTLKSDYAVAAPMYIPEVCEVFPQAFELFAYVASKTSERLLFGHSSLSLPLIQEAAELTGMRMDIKFEMEMPFAVEYADYVRGEIIKNNAPILNEEKEFALISHGLKVMMHGKEKQYFHRVMVTELSN